MLLKSQPIDLGMSDKFISASVNEIKNRPEQIIQAQYMSGMADEMLEKRKIGLRQYIKWLWRDIKNTYYDVKYTIRNHIKWHKTLSRIRPWEGFAGIIEATQTHLRDYIATEEKYGNAAEEYKNQKIASAKETVAILENMKDPHGYWIKLYDEINAKYPSHQNLITDYEDGGCSFSGDYAAQGNGWVGFDEESGEKELRAGYFEFINGRLEPAKSPDQNETDRVFAELIKYDDEMGDSHKRAEIDSDRDFARLGELLKENLYTWWD